jgi:hypothetical protein
MKTNVMNSRWANIACVAATLMGGTAAMEGAAMAGSSTGESHTDTGAAREVRITAKVTAIDPSTREVTLQADNGETNTVEVPPSIREFDKVKVGDKVDLTYYQGYTVSMLPPGSKPTSTEQTFRSTTPAGAPAVGRQMTISGEVVSVDVANNTVTFRGPRGVRTLPVRDPNMQKKLPSVRPGQVFQITYLESTAASLRPAAGR